MITEQGMFRIATAVYGLMDEIRVIFDDDTIRSVPIHKHEVTAEGLKLMGLLDSTVVGNIKTVQVIDANGIVILDKPNAFVKTEVYGLLTVFRIRIMEVS